MPDRRWELILIDKVGQKLAAALDLDATQAERHAVEWNATQVPGRRGRWVAQPKEPTTWNPR